MDRRNFIRLAGGGLVVGATAGLTGCSSALPPEAVAAWRGPADNTADIRRWLLSYAILAPHSHNLQSWLVDLRQPDEMMLYCDLSRLLPETDPMSRQMMISQGTFIELLDLAARRRGLRADIELFPQGEFDPVKLDRRPTARIRLTPDAQVRPDPLFDQILLRRTNREAYEARPPAGPAVEALKSSMASHAVKAGFIDSTQGPAIQQHRDLANEAFRIELVTPHTLMESIKVLRVGPREIAQHRDGLSVNTPMVRLLSAVGLFDRSKPPAPTDAAVTSRISDFKEKMEATPAFFWMVTQGNSRKTQINTGRAYVRAQLAATQHGVSMQPLSQALQEYPEQRETYARIHRLVDAPAPSNTVQMWMRLGYAPPVGPSPRRGVEAHIV
jgi:hypothetical protein